MGSSLAALRAGATPKMMPTREETPTAKRMLWGVTLAGKKLLMAAAPREPNMIPVMPPTAERMMASKRNWRRKRLELIL